MATGDLQSLASLRPPIGGMGNYEKFIAPVQKPLEEATRAQAETNAASQQLEGEQGVQKAQGAAQVERTFADKSAALPQREEMRAVSADMGKPFIPTQENTKDLASLFSLVNIVGFAIGAGGKSHAQAAMSAMDGMLKGHQQGREDLYKQEKGKFDENMKALKTRFDALDRELKDALDTYKSDKEAGLREVEVALAQHKADFLRQYKDKLGVAAMADFWRQAKGAADKAYEVRMREEDRAERLKQHQQDMAQRERMHAETLQAQKERQAGGGRAIQQQFMAQRAINGLGGVASAVESLQQLPAGTTTGILPNLKTKDGMINYVRNAGARKVTSDEAEAMNTLFTGIGRNLASIEASGAATGLQHLADQMQGGLYINAGVDTPRKVAIKLADIRRVATENIRPAIESGLLGPQQAEVARKLVERIEKAIPYTTADVTRAITQGRKTVGESAAAGVAGTAGGGWTDADEKRLQELEKKHGGS